jgi:hypothetical protein
MFEEIMTQDEYLASEYTVSTDVSDQFSRIGQSLGDVGMRLGIFRTPTITKQALESSLSCVAKGTVIAESPQATLLALNEHDELKPAYATPESLNQLLLQRDDIMDFKVLPAIAHLKAQISGLGKAVNLMVRNIDPATLPQAIERDFHGAAPFFGQQFIISHPDNYSHAGPRHAIMFSHP